MKHSIALILFSFFAQYAANDPICLNGFSRITQFVSPETKVNDKCWKVFQAQSTFKNAEGECSSFGGTLATIKNEHESKIASTLAKDANLSTSAWIGLYCFESDSSKCLWDDSTGSANQYNNFATGFPNTEKGNCVFESLGADQGMWFTGECDFKRAFICETPTTFADDCQYNYNGHCFTFHNERDFDEAKLICEEECGHLASITSENENRYVVSIARQKDFLEMYIGAVVDRDDNCRWLDGTPWNYTNVHKRELLAAALLSSFLVAPGNISSPNYPNNYDKNLFCLYHLVTAGPNRLLIRFLNIFTEVDHGVVNVYDGDSTDSPLLQSFTGIYYDHNFKSSGNNLLVTFQSDNGIPAKGFQAFFYSFS